MIDYYKENGKFPLETQEDLKDYKTIPITRGYGFVKHDNINWQFIDYRFIRISQVIFYLGFIQICFNILHLNFTCIQNKKRWSKI